MNSGVGVFLLALMLAPVDAGSESAPVVPEAVLDGDPVTEAPVSTGAAPAAEATPDPKLLALQPATTRLFHALKTGASDEEVERLVSAVAIELDMNCPRVKEYQVYRASTRARTLKIKCVERPVYAVTVGLSGEGFVSGGDGTIGQMRLADGPIKTMLGVRVEEYVANQHQAATQASTAAGRPGDAAQGNEGRIWLIRLAKAAAIGIAAWLTLMFIRERRRQRRSLSRWRGLDSDSKDQMVEESEEIYPNLYRHPDGLFIARGRRGKRRLFSSLVFAYLYSSRGIKLFEIQ